MKRTRLAPGFFNGNIDRFCSVLNRMRPQRKELSQDAERMSAVLKAIVDRLQRQMEYEEGSLFPFVVGHVPRLNGLVETLLGENEDLRRLVNDLRLDLETLRAMEAVQAKLVQKIRSEGAYLSCLLRSHLALQQKCIYDSLSKQLKPHEKAAFDRIRESAERAAGKGEPRARHDRAAVAAPPLL